MDRFLVQLGPGAGALAVKGFNDAICPNEKNLSPNGGAKPTGDLAAATEAAGLIF